MNTHRLGSIHTDKPGNNTGFLIRNVGDLETPLATAVQASRRSLDAPERPGPAKARSLPTVGGRQLPEAHSPRPPAAYSGVHSDLCLPLFFLAGSNRPTPSSQGSGLFTSQGPSPTSEHRGCTPWPPGLLRWLSQPCGKDSPKRCREQRASGSTRLSSSGFVQDNLQKPNPSQ